MSFSDLLNSPLPSAFEESTDDMFDDDDFLESFLDEAMEDEQEDGSTTEEPAGNDTPGNTPDDDKAIKDESCSKEGCGEEGCSREGCGREGCCKEDDDLDDNYDDDDDDYDDPEDVSDMVGGVDDDDEDFDVDDLSDEELSRLDSELSDGAPAIADAGFNDSPKSLSPEEEREADDMMGVAATSVIINKELNAEERAEFIESESNVQIAINEGLLMESDVNEMAEELGLVEENSYNKKMVVRLDKQAKMKQLYSLGVRVSAAAHRDPDYIKLKKVEKMRKILKRRLDGKYHNEGMKRMKVYFKRLTQSKSKVLSSIGRKFS